MIQYDTHLHSEYSTDSRTPVKSQLETAKKRGLSGVCLTDHMDYGFPEDQQPVDSHPLSGPLFVFDPEDYRETLRTLRPSFPELEIMTGVECGLQLTPDIIKNNRKLASEEGFDYMIGSLHLVDRKDPYYARFWEGETPETRVRAYFEQLLDNITAFHEFDSLGHLDYIVRYAPDTFTYVPGDYREIIGEILRFLIRKDIALEINTSGWKSTEFPNPHPEILDWYVKMGGELVTVGSDSHVPEYVAFSFDRAARLLEKAGISQYTIYKNHYPVFHEV